jgi:hypothetical protein
MQITGTLRKDRAGRWEIVDDIGRVCVLSSGATCEVQIGGQWIATRIESGPGSRPAGGTLAYVAGSGSYDGYYHAVQLIILLCEGLPARAPRGALARKRRKGARATPSA